MKNFKITSVEDGKEYWNSRATTVTGCIVALDKKGDRFYLVSRRGPGCPDHNGKMQITCGYFDWDETLDQAVKREVYEELGLDIDSIPHDIWEFECMSDPKQDARQNICHRYIIQVSLSDIDELFGEGVINSDTASRGGEDDEVSDIQLISISEVKNHEWAFGHDRLLERIDDTLKLRININ